MVIKQPGYQSGLCNSIDTVTTLQGKYFYVS